MEKLSLTTIILTFNEELHIRRCLENVCAFAERVVIIDCHSVDATCAIASEFSNCEVVQHDWPGNQAAQFNWALDNVVITTDWVLRLDADEYLFPALVDELYAKLPSLPEDVSSVSLPLARAYGGKILKHGIVNSIRLIRLFRRGTARYENRVMDEHLEILSGRTVEFENKFVDDSRIPITQFTTKHVNYAVREAYIYFDRKYQLEPQTPAESRFDSATAAKRSQKSRYDRLPLFWRAWAYFFYRHILRLGFLDGKEGFMWDFFQGLWYRLLVDSIIYDVKKACGDNAEKIIAYFRNRYHFHL